MSKNGHGKRPVAVVAPQPAIPANVATVVTLTAYTDRPPSIHSTGSLPDTVRLLGIGVATIGESMAANAKAPTMADPVDKKREFLGARETINYGVTEPNKGGGQED